MTLSTSTAIQLVPLTARDLQWIASLDAAISTLLNYTATDDELEHNIAATEYLFAVHYSRSEALALRERIHALLPADTPMRFTNPQLHAVSSATMFS